MKFKERTNEYGWMRSVCPICDDDFSFHGVKGHIAKAAKDDSAHNEFYLANTEERTITKRFWKK